MPLIDYLLLTPLDEEWRSARAVLHPSSAGPRQVARDATTYYLWHFAANQAVENGASYLVAAASMARRTPGQAHAGVFATHALREWKPERVVLLGIAGSLDAERVRLGDVVVADEIFGYEVGDVVGRKISYRPTFHSLGALDLDRVRAFLDDPVAYPHWQKECFMAGNAAGLVDLERQPRLHIVGVASGNKVVKSVSFGRKLRKDISAHISAVEMEAEGLYQALYQNEKSINALMIRGVSDYADGKKKRLDRQSKGAWRSFASANGARLLRTIWERGSFAPLSPSYRLDTSIGPHDRFRREGIPNIEYKQIGAQDLAFPDLIRRSTPTPRLTLTVRAARKDGAQVVGIRGLCIADVPKRELIYGEPTQASVIRFALPPSEWGMNLELLLSFPNRIDTIEIVCEDEFQRSVRSIVAQP